MLTRWKLIRDDEHCIVKDMPLDGLTVSHTTLKPKQATRGHSHPHAEVYLFKDYAELYLDKERREVYPAEFVFISKNAYHRVFNIGNSEVEFYAFFQGNRSEAKYPK